MLDEDSAFYGSDDRSRIDVDETFDVTYWGVRLRCSEEQLRHAVKTVGALSTDVETFIRRQQRLHGIFTRPPFRLTSSSFRTRRLGFDLARELESNYLMRM